MHGRLQTQCTDRPRSQLPRSHPLHPGVEKRVPCDEVWWRVSGKTSHNPPPNLSSICFLLCLKSLYYKLIPLNCAFPPFQSHPLLFRLALGWVLLSLHSSGQASLFQEGFPDCCCPWNSLSFPPFLSLSPHSALAFGFHSPSLGAERALRNCPTQTSLSPHASDEETEAHILCSQGSWDEGQANSTDQTYLFLNEM